MSRAARWIGLAAVVLFAVAVIVAVTQPGDLSDDDDDVALSTSTTEATVPEGTTTAPTTAVAPTTTAPPTGGTGTGGTGTGGTGTGTGGTAGGGGSGLGTGGTGSAQPGELVNSGHESLLIPGLLLAAVGTLGVRRRRTGRT